jgi:hypothetical protein
VLGLDIFGLKTCVWRFRDVVASQITEVCALQNLYVENFSRNNFFSPKFGQISKIFHKGSYGGKIFFLVLGRKGMFATILVY